MKTQKKYISSISLLLALLLILQGCRVYKRDAVTIDDAVSLNKRVKIKTIDGSTFEYKDILKEDGQFYGVKRVYGEDVKEPIDVSTIEKVRVHNKTMSIIYGIVFGAAVTLVTLTGIVFISLGL